jgi:hypothetical protein
MDLPLVTVGVGGDSQAIGHQGTTTDRTIPEEEERHGSLETLP